MAQRKSRPRSVDDDPLLESRPDPESLEESEDYRREEDRRRLEEDRPPHHEDR